MNGAAQDIPLSELSGEPKPSGELEAVQKRVRVLERELEATRRLAMIGATMSGLAHSIRSALGLCRAATHMVDRALHKDDGEEIRRGWEMVKRSSSRTAEMVAALLDPEGAGILKPSPGDPDALVREVCEVAIEQAADQGDQLICELVGGLDGLVYDRQAVHRVCVELLSNSLDALAESSISGQVVISTEHIDGGWALNVIDTGPGMSAERLGRVLEGGYSTKGKGGSGLGLLQVRELVKAHGGTVGVTSTPGKGTEVRCLFPDVQGSSDPNEA